MSVPLSPSAPRVTKAEVLYVLQNDPTVIAESVKVQSVIDHQGRATVFDIQLRKVDGPWIRAHWPYQRRMDGSIARVGFKPA